MAAAGVYRRRREPISAASGVSADILSPLRTFSDGAPIDRDPTVLRNIILRDPTSAGIDAALRTRTNTYPVADNKGNFGRLVYWRTKFI